MLEINVKVPPLPPGDVSRPIRPSRPVRSRQ